MSELLSVYDIADGDRQTAIFLERGLTRALRFHLSDKWRTDSQTLEELVQLLEAEVLSDWWRKDNEEMVLELQHAVLFIGLERPIDALPLVWVNIRAGSRRAAKLELARIKELLPPAEPPATDLIEVGFWYRGPREPKKVYRSIDARGWAESASNYPTSTRLALEPSMSDAPAVIASGKLLLWHGPPGTGKTSALRTLARENRDQIGLEYVLDPEAFFGKDAGYFVAVLFDDDDEDHEGERKVRLLVLEDCDELLSSDAKERAGQGLARLLNLVDGIIGQGLKIAVMITTNEPITAFHPAVSRPGRCGSVIGFELFSADEAAEWLATHDIKARLRSPASLAELFALRDGGEPPHARVPIGFLGPALDGRE